MALIEDRESTLYPAVARWLRKHKGCFKTEINAGLKYSRIDVVGVRDVGGELSGQIETISIEVKRGSEPFATASGQASGYKVYAHRVYLADVRDRSFSRDEIDIAGHLGIGLIAIVKGRCREVLTSPVYAPLVALHLPLLERLCLAHCELCKCYFKTGSTKTKRWELISRRMRTAANESKGLVFWNTSVGERKIHLRTIVPDEIATYERRFMCADCVEHLKAWQRDLASE